MMVIGMGSNDELSGPARKPRGKNVAGNTDRIWKQSADDSSGLFAGIVFLSVIIVLIGLLIGGVVLLVGPMLSHPDSNPGLPAPGITQKATAVMPQATAVRAPATITPTFIVKPASPPDMFDRSKLKETVDIVGLWQSTRVFKNGYWLDTNNFNLTIYNDNTYIIFDKERQTYSIGTWNWGDSYGFNITESGRYVPSRISGGFSSLQLQYNVIRNDFLPGYELVDYERIYYNNMYLDV